MKCPHRFVIKQKFTIDYIQEDSIIKKEDRNLLELQDFGECYQEECGCWDTMQKICKRS